MEKYAGIDIAKRTHWMCVTDGEGRFLMEPRPYDNDAEGLSRMVADLDLCGGDVAVGMESTGGAATRSSPRAATPSRSSIP